MTSKLKVKFIYGNEHVVSVQHNERRLASPAAGLLTIVSLTKPHHSRTSRQTRSKLLFIQCLSKTLPSSNCY